MDQIIKVAWELNENAENRYKLVYEIAELAKKLVDETQMKNHQHTDGDCFGSLINSADSYAGRNYLSSGSCRSDVGS